MDKKIKPMALKNAPLEYAPSNELGVVYLFSHVAKKMQFRIEEIKPQFPDCIAYRRIGNYEKRVRIEFEYKSSSFKSHGHNSRKCDVIVCWHHDWPNAPASLEIISLKSFFGVSRNIWIQQAIKSQWKNLENDVAHWQLGKNVTQGDIVLIYRCTPLSAITDLFVFSGDGIWRGRAGWRRGECYAGEITRICNLGSPIFLTDIRRHNVLKTASFVRRNMQGVGLLATEYWPYLYEMIIERNPSVRKMLNRLRPETL